MIELIFVIVILGILAAVAIPKFTATRDDAEVSRIARNIGTSMAEISSYAVSKGAANKDFLVMSNAMKSLKDTGNVTLSDNKAIILIDGSACINVEVIKNTTNDDLLISFINSTNSKCINLQTAIDAEKYPIKLRGASVTY